MPGPTIPTVYQWTLPLSCGLLLGFFLGLQQRYVAAFFPGRISRVSTCTHGPAGGGIHVYFWWSQCTMINMFLAASYTEH